MWGLDRLLPIHTSLALTTLQVHECPNSDSCTTTSRSASLLAYQRGIYNGTYSLYDASGLLVEATLAAYLALQCSTGYEGPLCGSCADGYGQTGTAMCKLCPSSSLNGVYYIGAACLNIILIVITIRWAQEGGPACLTACPTCLPRAGLSS